MRIRGRKREEGPYQNVRRGFLLLLLWVVLGAIGFSSIEDWSFADGLYMTLITITTVGYGEVHPLSPQGRLFASFIIIAGIGTAVYTFTRIGQLVFEGEFVNILGRRKMKRELERLENHFIVCGFGRIGKLVSEGLVEQLIPFCIVEKNPVLEEELRDNGYLYLIGDAIEEDVLREAGIEKAKSIFALLPSDADNLYLTMAAKEKNPKIRVIARVFDEKAELKLKRGGADEVVSPYKTASLRVLHAAIKPTLVDFMELATSHQQLELSLEEVYVAKNSRLAGFSIAEADVRRRYGVIVIAIKRSSGEMVFNPESSERTMAGDTLVALGKNSDLKKLEESCRGGV